MAKPILWFSRSSYLQKQKNSTSPVYIGLCEERNTTDEKQNEISLKNKNQHVEQKCEKQNENQRA